MQRSGSVSRLTIIIGPAGISETEDAIVFESRSVQFRSLPRALSLMRGSW